MWSPAAQVVWLLAAGLLAGTASASGAIGSLISYPALLAVGLPPITANITNAVAVTAVGVGATLGSRTELRGVGRTRVPGWVAVASVGGLTGALLLLVTPESAFNWVVPFLVLAGVIAMIVQPRVRAVPRLGQNALFLVGLAFAAGYEGYFGAGSGIMTLALVLLTVEQSLPAANAIKNGLLGVADATAGVVFIIAGSVAWTACAALGVGYLGGGLLGPAIVRRVSPTRLRVGVACFGVVLFVVLLGQAAKLWS